MLKPIRVRRSDLQLAMLVLGHAHNNGHMKSGAKMDQSRGFDSLHGCR